MEDMDFGQRVLELRKNLGIGQSALARTVGVSRQVVYQWESAGTKPEKVEVVLAVAAELKTSISPPISTRFLPKSDHLANL